MTDIRVGDFARAEYVLNLYGEAAHLDGVVTSVAEPFSKFNSTSVRRISVCRPDGSETTMGSSSPVTLIAPAEHPTARAAIATLLDSGKWLSERTRGTLEGLVAA